MSGSKSTPSKAATPAPVSPSQQVLKRIEVVQLKGLKDLSLDIAPAGLTAIMGANCSGKTTVLHALACAYKPLLPTDPEYRFPMFLKPNTDALWRGSEFIITMDYRVGTNQFTDQTVRFTKQADRWAPRFKRLPQRPVRFVQIRDSVPDLESITLNSMVHYTRTGRPDVVSKQVMDAAGVVLNRSYTTYDNIEYRFRGKKSIGVTLGALQYAGVAMSSGEQRVFKIIDTVFSAPKYALILVDELDLFLHQEAMDRLIDVMVDHCEKQNKQLVFTTHFPAVADLYAKVNISTIHRIGDKTSVWRGYSYEALRFITGKQEKPLAIHVEDDVALTIVSKVAADLGLRKYLEVGRYGPAKNAFTLGAGLILNGTSTSNSLIVLDGDIYTTEVERRKQVGDALTGTAPVNDTQREELFALIWLFKAEEGLAPEQMLHRMLGTIKESDLGDESEKALLRIAQTINAVPEKHGYVNRIIELSGEESRAVALRAVVNLAAKAAYWSTYTEPVVQWLNTKKDELNLS